MFTVDDGPDVDGLVEGIADPQLFHASFDTGMNIGSDGFLNQQATAGTTDLPLVEPDGIDESFDGTVDVGIFKKDVGALASQFEGQALATSGSGLTNNASHLCRAGEGDLVHVGVLHESRSRFTGTGDDIHDSRGESGLFAKLREEQCRKGSPLCRFENHGVATGQCGSDFPCEHQQGKIPRNDLSADSPGLGIRMTFFKNVGPPCMVIEVAGDEGDVDVPCLANRFSIVECLDHREEAALFLDPASEGVQVTCATFRAELLPDCLGGLGRFHGLGDIVGGS